MNKEKELIKEYFTGLSDNKESMRLNNDAAKIRSDKKHLVISSDMMIENSHFYRTNVYVEEELALFKSEMVDHLSFLYLVGENYLNNNLELEKAFQSSGDLLQAKKN